MAILLHTPHSTLSTMSNQVVRILRASDSLKKNSWPHIPLDSLILSLKGSLPANPSQYSHPIPLANHGYLEPTVHALRETQSRMCVNLKSDGFSVKLNSISNTVARRKGGLLDREILR